MPDEIARVLRTAVQSEIVRRGDRDLTQLLAEGGRDHIPLDDLADADGDVESAGDDVDHLVIQGEIEHNVGVGFA